MTRGLRLWVAAWFCLLACSVAQASVFVWDGGASTGNWADGANWNPDAAGGQPGASDTVQFQDASNPTVALPGGTTTIANLNLASRWSYIALTNAAATLNITGNLFSNTSYRGLSASIAPKVNVTGMVITAMPPGHPEVNNPNSGEATALTFTNDGNTFGGGFNVEYDSVQVTGNDNVIGGPITVRGSDWYAGLLLAGSATLNNQNAWGRAGGSLYFGGTGNNYSGVTSITLDTFGAVRFVNNADLGGVGAINFNGGTLRLEGEGNVFPAMTGGFNVVGGTLWVATNESLGTATNIIQLGGPHSMGMLTGFTYDAGDHAIAHDITLNGMGGVLRGYQDQSYWRTDRLGKWTNEGCNQFNVAATISGSGALIKTGNADTFLENGAATAFTANTYGDTVVAGPAELIIDTFRSVGTGNVIVRSGGELSVWGNAFGSMSAGKTVLLEGGLPGSPSLFDVMSANAAPPLDPNCDGVLALGMYIGLGDTSPIAVAMAAGIKGDGTNGKLWLGPSPAWGGGSYSANTMAPGSPVTAGGKNTYRLGGAQFNGGVVYINSSCLAGDADVWVKQSGVNLYGNNTFTGALTIQETLSSPGALWFWGFFNTTSFGRVSAFTRTDSDATKSAIGAASGDVKLMNGGLDIEGNDGGLMIQKAGLSVNGTGLVQMDGQYTTSLTQVSFSSLTRVNRGDLMIMSTTAGLGAAGTEKLFIGGMVPADSSGMVAPYVVAANAPGTGDYLTYGTADGFTKAPFVSMPAAGGDGTAIAQTAGAALTGDVSVNALRADGAVTGAGKTVTIGSGGLILTGSASAATVHTADFKFGATGSAEAVIFANSSYTSQLYDPTLVPELDGQLITTGGLTKTGQGVVRMGTTATDRSGSLFGDITVNEGASVISNDKNLGAPGNRIVLNGGMLSADNNANGSYAQIDINRTVYVGPNGGTILSKYNGRGAFNFNAPFQDLVPGQSGPICFTYGDMAPHISVPSPNFSGGAIINGYLSMVASGTLGTGPIVVIGNLFNFSGDTKDGSGNPSVMDQSGSRMTILGAGQFQICSGPVKLGSLAGDGNLEFGHPGAGFCVDKTLTLGSDNTDADFYGTITAVDFMDPHWWEIVHTQNLVKLGAGTQTFWGNVGYYGLTTVNGGTLRINGVLAGGAEVGDVSVNIAGTLDGQGRIERNVIVAAGGHLNGGLEIDGNVSMNGGAANVTGAVINGGFLSSGSYAGASTINDLAGNGFEIDGGTFSGTHTINTAACVLLKGGSMSGADTINAPSVRIEGGTFSSDGVINITPGAGNGFYVNYSRGGGDVSGNAAINGDVYVQGHTFTGVHAIVGNVNVGDYNRDGSHPVFSGASNITGNVSVGLNGTFNGDHAIHGSFTTAASSNAVVAPHNGATASTLTIVGNVTLDHSTTLNFNLGAPGTVGGGVNDLIDVTGNVSLDGTLNVTGLTYFGQGTYTLLTYTGTLTNNLTLGTMPTGGYTYSFTSGTLHAGTVYELNLSVVSPFQPGDTNRDGVLNSLDIDAIYHNFNAAANSQWKVTTDGLVVGQEDVTYELRKYFLTNYGDANLDNATDFPDFQTLLDHWQASGSTIGWLQGDFNGDYSVDFLDFQKLLDYWNPGGWHYAPMATPEPASLSLLVLGGLALLRRKK